MQRRPCWVEISTRALENNYRLLADASPVELLAIVKADAYGHGLSLCAPAAVRALPTTPSGGILMPVS